MESRSDGDGSAGDGDASGGVGWRRKGRRGEGETAVQGAARGGRNGVGCGGGAGLSCARRRRRRGGSPVVCSGGSKSTNLDAWTPEQLKTMAFGGNNRAHTFFKQHGWADGGNVEAKYTSRAADLYRQLLAKEVAESSSEDGVMPSSPVAAPSEPMMDGLPDLKLEDTSKPTSVDKHQANEVVCFPKAPTTRSTAFGSVKKPLRSRKGVAKSGGLGIRKLTEKPNESVYDQKPEEPLPAVSSTVSLPAKGPSDTAPSAESSHGGVRVFSHISPPETSSIADFGMDNGFQKKDRSTAAKMEMEDIDETRRRFANAQSAFLQELLNSSAKSRAKSRAKSSADRFGGDMEDNSELDQTASDLVNRISFEEDISTPKDMAAETGKKLIDSVSFFAKTLKDNLTISILCLMDD